MNLSRQDHQALFRAFKYESISVAGTAVGLTASTYQPTDGREALRALITVETAQIRYRYDGGTPTSSEGHILNTNDVLTLEGEANIENFKAIRTGSSATIKVTYER